MVCQHTIDPPVSTVGGLALVVHPHGEI